MRVNNDFPNVDRVLSKLKEFVRCCEQRRVTHPTQQGICDTGIAKVDEFIDAIGNYLDSVCNGEDRIAKCRNSGADAREIQQMVASEDSRRTLNHSQIIITMVMIDRIASILGIKKVFDYAEEFQADYSSLLPSTVEEKSRMTERQRVKRRELGNFGLYIAASVTAGISKDYMISDDEAREFASCEDDVVKASTAVLRKVKSVSKGVRNNMDNILE